MKLFTGGIDKKLFAQFPKGSDLKNQKVIAKIFNPFGRGTWYIINSDPNDPDYLWAIVDLYEVEVGSVSRKELESVRIKPFGLKLERDMYFDEVNAEELFDGLLEGKRYSKGGYMAKGGIVVTSIKDIPNFEERLNQGRITYRGLGVGKLSNDFYNIAGEGGKMIKVDGKEYYITDTEFNSFSRDADGMLRVKFAAPKRRFESGGYMANGGELKRGDKIVVLGKEFEFIRYEIDRSQGYDEERILLKDDDGILSYPRDMVEAYSQYKMTKGGYMADGGGIGDDFGYHIINKEVELKNGKRIFLTKGRYFWSNELGDDSPSGVYYLTKDGEFISSDMVKFPLKAKGGYMAKGEDYEYVNTFKRFNSNVPVPQDDFNKLVDAYHKQLSGDKLDVAKYNVLKQQMGNYLGHKTIEEMEEYIEKTHEAHQYAKGGYMAKGGRIQEEGDYLLGYEPYFDKNVSIAMIDRENKIVRPTSGYYPNHPMSKKAINWAKNNGYDYVADGKKYEDGGYMAKGGKFNSPSHKVQNELFKLKDNGVTEVLLNGFSENINYVLGLNLDDDEIKKIGENSFITLYAKGGSIKEKADYVSNRNIKSITLTIDGKLMTIDGSSILDGVYVKKGTTQKAPRIQPKSVATKIADLAFDSWEKFDINSGGEIYASDDLQKKLNKDFKEKGIDEMISKLDMAQRKKVADILTDNNEHSLRNYLALRGYLGKEERDMYVSLYEERKKISVNLNPKNFPKVMAEGGRIGFEALSKKVAKRYEGKEVPSKYRSEYGSRYDKEEAKEVGDKVAAKVYRAQLGKK